MGIVIAKEQDAINRILREYLLINPNLLGLQTCQSYQKELIHFLQKNFCKRVILEIYSKLYNYEPDTYKNILLKVSFFYIKLGHMYSVAKRFPEEEELQEFSKLLINSLHELNAEVLEEYSYQLKDYLKQL
jgi:hypothetical protein